MPAELVFIMIESFQLPTDDRIIRQSHGFGNRIGPWELEEGGGAFSLADSW